MVKALQWLILACMVSSCVPIILGAGTEGAVVASQERTPGHALDDATIYLKIKEHFANQPNGDMFLHIDVKVVEGRVLLAGNVDRPESQIQAVKLVWEVPGVKEVMDEIQVNDKSGFMNYARDVWISTQVRTRLLFTRHIRSSNYSVITVNQVVYLMGIAQDQAELDRATSVASTTEYVQKVVSFVRLKDDPRRP